MISFYRIMTDSMPQLPVKQEPVLTDRPRAIILHQPARLPAVKCPVTAKCCMTLVIRFEQPVIAVFSLINRTDFIGIHIQIEQEIVPQHLHLQNSFVGIHRDDVK
jgi:hypothetical protein